MARVGDCSRAPARHDLRRHQALALAADPKQWPAAALAKKFKADAGSLERAIEYCSSYVVVHSSDGAAYAQKRPPPGAAGATAFSAAELGTSSDPLQTNAKRTAQKPVTFKAEV
jgi:hypothetical protein